MKFNTVQVMYYETGICDINQQNRTLKIKYS